MSNDIADGTTQPASAAPAPKSLWPTRKWLAATTTAIGALLVLYIQQNGFTDEMLIAMVSAAVQAVVTYLIPNAETPGGVPLKAPTAR